MCALRRLVEMARRLVLVGIFVLIDRGSIAQLMAGTFFCLVYSLLQMQAAPYVHLSDDYLVRTLEPRDLRGGPPIVSHRLPSPPITSHHLASPPITSHHLPLPRSRDLRVAPASRRASAWRVPPEVSPACSPKRPPDRGVSPSAGGGLLLRAA